MGDEIKIELPGSEPETQSEGLEITEVALVNELDSLKEEKSERIAADIIAAATLAQAAHDLATSAHDRIDEHNVQHSTEAITEFLEEAAEAQAEPEPLVEVEAEPEPEQSKDKEPERKHWFYR
jgi:hypothetical protein